MSTDITAAHQTLLSSPNHRVLVRPGMPQVTTPPEHANLRTAAFINIETTGLDASVHEIIQLSILPFTYALETNDLTSVGPLENQYQQPKSANGIPENVTLHHGITNDMVQSAEFELDKLEAILKEADLLIAHHARFVRPFLEKLLPLTEKKPWACLKQDVPWLQEGILRENLEHLTTTYGYFYNPYDPSEKTIAAVNLLTGQLPRSEDRVLAALRRSAGKITRRITVTPHDRSHANDFKARRYTWSDGREAHHPKGWWKDIPEDEYETEIQWLRTNVFNEPHDTFTPNPTDYNATQRYSTRPVPPKTSQ